jgi:hypothetical protein
MTTKPLYARLAAQLDIIRRNADSLDPFADMARDRVESMVRDYLPSGAGFDSGCYVEIEESRRDKIVIRCDFHHMAESGMYSGWTTHRAIVTPDLADGFALRITGKDRNGIKEYIADVMDSALNMEIEQ